MAEPIVAVGLASGISTIELVLRGAFRSAGDAAGDRNTRRGEPPAETVLTVRHESGEVVVEDLAGSWQARGRRIELAPKRPSQALFELCGMRIGLQFHWDQRQDLRFRGSLVLIGHERDGVTVINRIGIEQYLISVISSEMSAASPSALLEAHAVISRSWLMAQLATQLATAAQSAPEELVQRRERNGTVEIHRWYDRQSHGEFDVCADDHCQRYQGADRVASVAVVVAVEATVGEVLVDDRGADGQVQICDARYSKCCGGMTERFGAAWGAYAGESHPYLHPVVDAPVHRDSPAVITLPLEDELNAKRFILDSPDVWCRIRQSESELLDRVLPAIDQATREEFFRWQVTLEQKQLRDLIAKKTGVDVGSILGMNAVRRGASGRIEQLLVEGERRKLKIGKELEIRRLLSETHLLSSAFFVTAEGASNEIPARFVIDGAGWGHGVGLCQVGAAAMADAGHPYEEILDHYYRGSRLEQRYTPVPQVMMR